MIYSCDSKCKIYYFFLFCWIYLYYILNNILHFFFLFCYEEKSVFILCKCKISVFSYVEFDLNYLNMYKYHHIFSLRSLIFYANERSEFCSSLICVINFKKFNFKKNILFLYILCLIYVLYIKFCENSVSPL